MDCPRCGRASHEGDVFCASCGFDLRSAGVGAGGPSPAGTERPPAGGDRRFALLAVIVVLAVALGGALLALLLRGGGSETAGGETGSTTSLAVGIEEPATPAAAVAVGLGETEGEIFLEPAGSHGPDPFTGEIFTEPVVSTTAPLVSTTVSPTTVTTEPGQVVVVGEKGDRPGLYGGTRDNARCDAQGILVFLMANPAQAEAWVAALNADPTLMWGDGRTTLEVADLPAYFDELTPVTLVRDTRVTNHGFRDGRPTERQSVLQAGTAVLVDRYGVPRARCACGNPLTPPRPAARPPTYVGPAWPGFTTTIIIVIQRTVVIIDDFILIDVYTGDTFTRPAGTNGSVDIGESAGGAPDTEAPDTQPPGTEGVTIVPVATAYPPSAGIGVGAAYDSASFTVELDPGQLDWMTFSGFDHLVDQPMGVGADLSTDDILDIVFPDVDDYLLVEVTKDGVSSGPFILHDRDAMGTPIGNQALFYGYHPNIWYVSFIDWSTDPPTSSTTSGPETGEMTGWFDAQGAGTYEFEVTYINKWTDRVAHGDLYLLAGSAIS